jgi:hypothetical protein
MATADVEGAIDFANGYRPWSQRLIAASGLGPVPAAAALAAAQLGCLALVFGLGAWAGLRDGLEPWFWRQMAAPQLVMATLVGYAPAALFWSRRRARAQLDALAPQLEPGAHAEAHARLGFPRGRLALVGGGFAGAFVPLLLLDPRLRVSLAEATPLAWAWLLWVNVLVGWLMARAIFEELRVALLFARLGERVARVDLFDPHALDPFARRAVDGVLVWVLAASLNAVLFAGGWDSELLPEIVAAILGMAVVAFALPLLGVHRRIRAAKREELERIHAAARAERDALLAGGPGTRLPALLALRQQVAEVREWPVDLSTLARVALYLGIGLGSWVGAALVERVLEAVLR